MCKAIFSGLASPPSRLSEAKGEITHPAQSRLPADNCGEKLRAYRRTCARIL
jgi:hypothetical protein